MSQLQRDKGLFPQIRHWHLGYGACHYGLVDICNALLSGSVPNLWEYIVKYWLIFNLAIALLLACADYAICPLIQTGGPFNWATRYSLIRVSETNSGTVAEMVPYWREVSG
jgi:hypothetical protein